MTTKAPDATIEARLGIARGQAAAFRAEVAKLTEDAKLALYQSKPIDAINTKRQDAQAKIDELELLISELERRLPAEQRDRLMADLEDALAADAIENEKVAASRAHLKEMEAALDQAYRDHRTVELARDRVHGHSFSIGQQIRRHQEQHPALWGDHDA